MKKFILYILFILIASIIMSGCSIRYPVYTASVKGLKKDLMKVTDTIKSVNVTFIRPQVDYNVNMTQEPTQEILDSILVKVKSFTTADNMDEIARKVRWQGHISQVYLHINTDNDSAIEYEYHASYYKTANVVDTEDNIDAYRTWHQSEIQ